MKKVSLTVPELDQKLKELYNAENAETNNLIIEKVKHAMNEIIKNDLTKRQKQIIVMYYYKDMKMQDIADELNINVSTVSRTLNRARNSIFKKMQYYFY